MYMEKVWHKSADFNNHIKFMSVITSKYIIVMLICYDYFC